MFAMLLAFGVGIISSIVGNYIYDKIKNKQ